MTKAFQSNAFQNNTFQVGVAVTVTPPTLALVLSTYVPNVNIGIHITPATLALILTPYTPTVEVTEDIKVIPGTLALVLTTYSPTISVPGLVTPTTLALILTTYSPTILIQRLATVARKYTVELHNSDGGLVTILENAYGISYSETINEAPILNFSLPTDNDKAVNIIKANEIWLRDYEAGTIVKKFRLNLRRDTRP